MFIIYILILTCKNKLPDESVLFCPNKDLPNKGSIKRFKDSSLSLNLLCSSFPRNSRNFTEN